MGTNSSSPLVVPDYGAINIGWGAHDEVLVLHNEC